MRLRHASAPVPLARTVSELELTLPVDQLLELSAERDVHHQLRLAAWQEGYRQGYGDGYDAGRREEARERDQAWNAIAKPIARGGVTHAELERRRWGPGGREHFGDPRPGDRPGQRKGAA
jgi:hypothetical protein